jgi:hypothetical protein
MDDEIRRREYRHLRGPRMENQYALRSRTSEAGN